MNFKVIFGGFIHFSNEFLPDLLESDHELSKRVKLDFLNSFKFSLLAYNTEVLPGKTWENSCRCGLSWRVVGISTSHFRAKT
jgi:hypothetical protein